MLPRLSSSVNFTAIVFNSLRSSFQSMPPMSLMESFGHASDHPTQQKPHHQSWTSQLLSSLSSTSSTSTVRTSNSSEVTTSRTTSKISTDSTAQANAASHSTSLSSIPERTSRSRTASSSIVVTKNSAPGHLLKRSSQDSLHFPQMVSFPSPPTSFASSRSHSRSSTPTSGHYQPSINLLSPPYISSHEYRDQQNQSKLKIGRKANLASSPVPIALSPKVLHPVYDGVDCKTTKEYDSHIKIGKRELTAEITNLF